MPSFIIDLGIEFGMINCWLPRGKYYLLDSRTDDNNRNIILRQVSYNQPTNKDWWY
jgi:hypothetical protein